jgi:hypothetical protein
MLSVQEILTTAYGIAGAVGIAAYIPQFWALWKDKSGSFNVPLTTWILWGVQTVTYVLYALFVNRDPMFIAIMVATLLATHACLWMLIYNRYFRKIERNRRAGDPPLPPSLHDRY